LRDHGESKLAARRHVEQLLDINAATLRNWIEAETRAQTPVHREFYRWRGRVAAVVPGERRVAAGERDLKDRERAFAQAELDRRLK
jgi:transposase